jgi:arsenite transporter
MDLDLGKGSQGNIPIAILIWLMIVPMMMKVNFGAIRQVGLRPQGLLVTRFVNWLVQPFSMVMISWIFLCHVFAHWMAPAQAAQYFAGTIILAAAPCTAMVLVWSCLTDGDPAYTLMPVSVNDMIMLFLFAPLVRVPVSGAPPLSVP